MGINFPASPLVGDKYPTPALPGVPQYTWDGTMWTASSPPTSFVKIAGDTMTGDLTLPRNATSALHAVPKQQLDARVMDAMAYSGMQINGSFDVSQELGTTGRSTIGYVCDGWYLGYSATATVFAAQAGGGFVAGVPSCIVSYPQVAQTTLGAADYGFIAARIEGYRVARLAWGSASAQPITIGFWSSHGRTGIYSVIVQNAGLTRSYATTYTQAVSQAAQYNVVTIPGDVTGTWGTLNGIGMNVVFSFGCGTTYTAPSANTWLGANYVAAPGQVNSVASTSTDIFRITGVVVLPGIYAPTAAQSPLIMRPYDQELVTCQRYYEKTNANMRGQSTGAATIYISSVFWKVAKRANPSCSVVAGSRANITLIDTASVSINGCRLNVTTAASGDFYCVDETVTADIRL